MTPSKVDDRPRQDTHVGGTGRSRPPVDPRIRERRAAVARHQGRRRLRIVLALACLVALAAGAWWLLHSRLLSARVVTVSGAVHTPVPEVLSASGLATHPPLIDVDPGAVAARVERLPWVARATVSRHWPDGVAVTVIERQPVAVVSTAPPATATHPTAKPAPAAHPTAKPAHPTAKPAPAATTAAPFALVDASGRVLADVPTAPAGLLHLTVPVSPGTPGTDLAQGAQPGLKVAGSLPRAFSAQVTGVEVARGGLVTLTMTTPVTVRLGDTAQLAQKYEDVAAILAGAKLVSGDVIDVEVPGSPTVGEG